MSKEFKPYPYQQFTVEKIKTNPYSGVFLDMGLGKTVSTLTALESLMFDELEVTPGTVLVVAPKRVAESVWSDEVSKWSHLRGLSLSVIAGDGAKRMAAVRKKADIYVIGRDNIVWLTTLFGKNFPFKVLVIDELSSFKDPSTQRFKALRRIRPQLERVIGLTGTPTSNKGLLDLWSQVWLLDMGDRLGKTVTGFRSEYFSEGRRNGNIVYDYNLRENSKERIYEAIGDICFSMKSEDYISLPDIMHNTVELSFSPAQMAKYESFEKELILSIGDVEIDAINAAALSMKLRQYAMGLVYDSNKEYHEVHDLKLEALEEILETSAGQSVLVFYYFKSELDRIKKKLARYKPRELKTPQDIKDWNDGKIPFLLVHPRSAGHGLNLQDGGSIIVWSSMDWSLESYQQAVKRLHRPGQKHPVVVHQLVVKGTIDEDIVKSLASNTEEQSNLMEAIKARMKKYMLINKN